MSSLHISSLLFYIPLFPSPALFPPLLSPLLISSHTLFSPLQLFVNEAQVNVSNIMTGKGVIHGLSSVLEINRNRCDKAQYQTMMVK